MCYSKERIQNKSAERWAFFQYKMKSSSQNKMIMSKTDFGSVTKAKIIRTVGRRCFGSKLRSILPLQYIQARMQMCKHFKAV